MSGGFLALWDVKRGRWLYQRGAETYVEQETDERPQRCMPLPADGWVRAEDVLALCRKAVAWID
jgi:hypothetical protein